MEERKVKEFNLPIGTLQFSEDECKEGTIEIITLEYLDKKLEFIINRLPELLSISNKEKSLIAIDKLAESCIDDYINSIVIKALVNYKIYGYNLQEIRRRYVVDQNWKEAYQNLVDSYETIKNQNIQEREYRAARKANRSRWQGGGFGMRGAIKGAAEASVLNGISGLGHSFSNAIGNANSDYQANKKMNALFEEAGTADKLAYEIGIDIVGLKEILLNVLEKNGVLKRSFDINEADTIYSNLKLISDEEEEKRVLCKCMKLYPLNEEFCKYYIENYLDLEIYDVDDGYKANEINDEVKYRRYAKQWKSRADRIKSNNKDFFEFCEYFAINWKSLLIEDMFNDLSILCDYESFEDSLGWVISYCMKKRMCGITDELIEEEKDAIKIYDLAIDKSKMYLASESNKEEDATEVQNILNELRTTHEIDAKSLQRLIYISRCRIIKGDESDIKIENAESAIDILKNQMVIEAELKKCNFSTEKIEKLKVLIQKINGGQTGKRIGAQVETYLDFVKACQKTVFDFFVIHDDYDKNIKNFTKGQFRESLILKQDSKGNIIFDKEYFDKSYHCENEEEQSEINQQIEDIHEKYNRMDLRNTESIKAVQTYIRNVYEKTKLGGTIIQELSRRLEYLDRFERTVLGVIYDTKEEADRERKKVVGNDKYETEEEAKCAKKELNKINLQIKQSKDYKELKQYILSYRALEGQNIQSVSGNKRKQEIASDIIQQYIQLNDSIRDAEKQKNMIPKWHVAEIIVGIVGVFVYFNGGFFSKLLGIGMVIFAIYHAVKITNQMKESMLDSFINEKNIIDKMMFIRNNTIFFRETSNEKVCPICGATVRDSMNFCTRCGAKIQVPIHTNSNMNKCPTCGADIKSNMKFCTQCGATLKDTIEKNKSLNVCPACGAKVETGMKFCTQCGQTLKNTNEGEKNVL